MNNELQEILTNEYDIQVFREGEAGFDLLASGYRIAMKAEINSFNMLFQYAPEIAKDNFYANTFKETYEGAIKESYRVKIGPGLHLGRSHTTEGAFKGNAYDANNKLRGQADWIKNEADLNLSLAPQIAASVFNVISFATGQYFLGEINKNLITIKKGTEEIKRFLENFKDSKIVAATDELAEIKRHIEFIQKDPGRKRQTLIRLNEIQDTARTFIAFSQKSIDDEKGAATDKDKDKDIVKHLQTTLNALMQYRILLGIFCQSKLMEIYLNNIQDIDELTLYRNEIDKRTNAYLNTYKNTIDWMYDYLNSNHSLNDISSFQVLVSACGGAVPFIVGGPIGIPFGLVWSKYIYDTINDAKEMKKRVHFDNTQNYLDAIATYNRTVKEPVTNLTRYIDAAKKGFEVIKAGDNIFTDLPKMYYVRDSY